MRALFAIIILAFLGWGGYWFVGSAALDRAWLNWFAARNAQGWRAEYASLEVAGFPNRFDTTIDGIDLRAPGETWSWSAPFVQVLALSYHLSRVIVVWPHDQTIATAGQTIDLKTGDMRGSVAVSSLISLALDHIEVVAKTPVVTSDAGWTLAGTQARFATRRNASLPNGVDIGFVVVDLAPGGPAVEALAGVPALPKSFSDLHADVTVGLSAPLDRSALGRTPPQVTELRLNTVHAAWGDMDISATGKLDIDRAGVPTGAIKLEAADWRTMLDLLTATGVLRAKDRPDVENALQMLADRSGDPGTIDVTLNFRGGYVAAGLVPIGRAPRIVIR